MADASLTPGTLVAEHFEVLSQIAGDTLVERYLARDLSRRGHVLLHILHRDPEGDGPDMPLKELEEAARLFHPNLAAHHGCGRSAQDLLFMVQGYPPGELLDDVIEARVGVHPLKTTLRRGAELLDGLSKAHEAGVYHGAIGPRAVLVEHIDATHERARILGLGVEQALHTGRKLERRPVSQRYTPPDGATGAAADLYGVGALLLSMFGGEDALDVFRRDGVLPGKIDASPLGPILKKALAPLERERFADADAFRRALQDQLDDLTRSAPGGGESIGITTDDPTFDGALSSIVGVNNPGLDIAEVSDTSWTDLLPELSTAHDASSPLAALHEELALQREAARGGGDEEEPTRISGPPVPDEDEAAADAKPHRVAFPDPVAPAVAVARPANKTNIALSSPPPATIARPPSAPVDPGVAEDAADESSDEAVDAALDDDDAETAAGEPPAELAEDAADAAEDAADAAEDAAEDEAEGTDDDKPAGLGGRKPFEFSLSDKLGLKLKKKAGAPIKSPFSFAKLQPVEPAAEEPVAEDAPTEVRTAVSDVVEDDDGVVGDGDVTHLGPAPTREEKTFVGKPALAASSESSAGASEQRSDEVARGESTQISQRPVVAGPPPPPRPIQLPLAPEGPPPGSSFELLTEFGDAEEAAPIADDEGVTPLRSPEPIGEVIVVEHAALLPSTVPIESLLARELEPDNVEETTQPRTPRSLVEAEGGGTLGDLEPEDDTTDEAAVTGVEARIVAAANDDEAPTDRRMVWIALAAVAAIVLVVLVWPGGGDDDAKPTQTEREAPAESPETTAPTRPDPVEVRAADTPPAQPEATSEPPVDGPATEPPADNVVDGAPDTPTDAADETMADGAGEPVPDAAGEAGAQPTAEAQPDQTDPVEDEAEAERRRERREKRRKEREAEAAKKDDTGKPAGGDILNLKVD